MHGINLEQILTELVEKMGWEEMAYRININCFASEPSIRSSLNFLRKTPWARNKVEKLYMKKILKLDTLEIQKKGYNDPAKKAAEKGPKKFHGLCGGTGQNS